MPQESREYLDSYLEKRKAFDDEPLFITRYGTRLQTLDVYRICQYKDELFVLSENELISIDFIEYRDVIKGSYEMQQLTMEKLSIETLIKQWKLVDKTRNTKFKEN